jgi:ADP-heptose:LPS heptosyltransferase
MGGVAAEPVRFAQAVPFQRTPGWPRVLNPKQDPVPEMNRDSGSLSVLIVFLHGLGDNVMLTGPLREYHKANPSHRISLLILDNGSPQVWRNNPHVDQIFTSRTGHNPHYWDPFLYWRKDFWDLKQEIRHVCGQKHFDRVIHVSIGCMPELYYRLTRTYGPHKTHRIAHDLGIPPENLTPELFLPLDTARAGEFLSKNELARYAVLHPFSRNASRGLRAASTQPLVEVLRQQGLRVVVAGRTREIEAMALQHVTPAADLSLNCLLAIISQAEVFLGTDSGIAHLAGTVARKMVVLSTRTKALHLTNCGHLRWTIPYSATPIEVLEMNSPGQDPPAQLARLFEKPHG